MVSSSYFFGLYPEPRTTQQNGFSHSPRSNVTAPTNGGSAVRWTSPHTAAALPTPGRTAYKYDKPTSRTLWYKLQVLCDACWRYPSFVYYFRRCIPLQVLSEKLHAEILDKERQQNVFNQASGVVSHSTSQKFGLVTALRLIRNGKFPKSTAQPINTTT